MPEGCGPEEHSHDGHNVSSSLFRNTLCGLFAGWTSTHSFSITPPPALGIAWCEGIVGAKSNCTSHHQVVQSRMPFIVSMHLHSEMNYKGEDGSDTRSDLHSRVQTWNLHRFRLLGKLNQIRFLRLTVHSFAQVPSGMSLCSFWTTSSAHITDDVEAKASSSVASTDVSLCLLTVSLLLCPGPAIISCFCLLHYDTAPHLQWRHGELLLCLDLLTLGNIWLNAI